MKILAHINKVRFIIKKDNKYFLLSVPKKDIIEIEDPNEIYRQGYWELFNEKLDDNLLKVINNLYKTYLQSKEAMV